MDPAWLPDELEAIADEVAVLGVSVTAGFSTHPHHDHLLWHRRLGDVPRWASARGAAAARDHADELLAYLGPHYPPDVLEVFAAVEPLPSDVLPQPFGPDGVAERFEVVVHDGHAPGHAALWAPDRGVLVVGDMLSDVEVPLPFWPDDLPAYLAGLDALAPFVFQASVLVPGHGSPTSAPVARLDADRRYLDAVLAGRTPDDERLANPRMREEYEHLVRMVSGQADV
ncbi:MBL fold metallo-hydrolase [Angustibacter sp. McL0619]|uniref:MBL fold metallo-hydrolase n=1 Tax=Angustibacter sp. McL0619 TaxID=3415676 RepID=UPI003CE9EF5B